MHYQNFSVEDFIADEDFIAWVKHPDASSDAFWAQLIETHPALESKIQEAKAFVLGLEFELPPFHEADAKKMLENIHAEIEAFEEAPQLSVSYSRSNFLKIAAGFLLVISAFGAYFWLGQSPTSFQTHNAETKTILLPDQSEVVLNANSNLHYSKSWKPGELREIWLDGEAYFKVTKAASFGGSKFLVHAGALEVEVLGTEFNVNSRKENIRVLLTEGSIKVNMPNAVEVLEKENTAIEEDALIEYSNKNQSYEQKIVESQPYISWKDRKLKFEDTPLTELITILENNYGLEVLVSDTTLLKESLSGSLPYADEALVFTALETVFNIEAKQIKDRQVLLQKK